MTIRYRYRLSFNYVKPWKAELLDHNTPNSVIPEEYWTTKPTFVVTEDPWDQYHQLKEWADNDTGMVRNVKLEQAVQVEPVWEVVTDD